MANLRLTRLKVILGEHNIEKLTFPNGIPESLDELLNQIKTTFKLKEDFRLQYMDQDFGNDFFNLNSTADLHDLGTVKVIYQEAILTLITASESTSSHSLSFDIDDSISLASNDTVILSSPESISSRKRQWPEDFPIPQFSYDTELLLEKGNSEYDVHHKMLTLTSRIKTDILNRLAEEIYQYKAYPEDAHFSSVAEALIKRHPCLKEPGSFNGCYGWKQRLKYKMGNYRTHLKLQGCPELSVNFLIAKAPKDAFPAKKVKKPKRAEANFYPGFPVGETVESLEKERLELLTEINKKNNERINAEFQRLMAVPLEEKFMAQLDLHLSQLIKVVRSKGGTTRQKTAHIIETLDQTEDIHLRRESVLKALIIFLGEDPDDLIKEYLDSTADNAQIDLEQLTMGVFVIRKQGEGPQEPPENIGIVIEGVEVLNELNSVASACALLLGLIYELNLAYPKCLHFTFEVLQKIIMELDKHKMSPKVQNLFCRLKSSE
ncbi:uncharacterized protein LOC128521020 [Clarias gariepinus]|uniref:uncharacterized protein LOC128521020 n=1 Tax=Clarias gariepinus TaxID=13013 RepID=UPI00234C1CD5|nr:uncharacterized protein LOC128521020 [Clarias gariepinus]